MNTRRTPLPEEQVSDPGGLLDALAAPTGTRPAAFPYLQEPPRGTRPRPWWRVFVALVEVLVAGLLGIAAVWAWRHGVVVIEFPAWQDGEPPQSVTRYHGQWIGSAVILAVLASFALLDVLRQLILLRRAR